MPESVNGFLTRTCWNSSLFIIRRVLLRPLIISLCFAIPSPAAAAAECDRITSPEPPLLQNEDNAFANVPPDAAAPPNCSIIDIFIPRAAPLPGAAAATTVVTEARARPSAPKTSAILSLFLPLSLSPSLSVSARLFSSSSFPSREGELPRPRQFYIY